MSDKMSLSFHDMAMAVTAENGFPLSDFYAVAGHFPGIASGVFSSEVKNGNR